MVQRSEVADAIVSAVGYPAAVRLFEYYGGMSVKIPNGLGKPGLFVARLIELLGEDGYKSLIAHMGGEKITMPKNKAAAMIARNRQIVADYEAKTPMRDLVRRYDLCDRQIHNILGRPVE